MSTPTDLIPMGCLHESVNEQGDPYLTGSLGLARFMIMKVIKKPMTVASFGMSSSSADPASQPDVPEEAQSNWHHPSRRTLTDAGMREEKLLPLRSSICL